MTLADVLPALLVDAAAGMLQLRQAALSTHPVLGWVPPR